MALHIFPDFLTQRRLAGAAASPVAANTGKMIDQYQILDTLPEPHFDDVAALAAKVCGTAISALSFVDGDRQWFKAVFGLTVKQTPVEQSFCAHAIRRNDIFLVEDASKDPVFATNVLVTGAPYIRFYAGVPVCAPDGTRIATLCVIDPKPRLGGLDEGQVMTLKVLAKQVEAQLSLRRAVIERDACAAGLREISGELQHVADHDPLTGLPNRVFFNHRLTEALQQADVNKSRAALLLIDVDHFKQINDSLGHDAGDALLRAFSGRLRTMVRSSDTASRIGGDEFAVVLGGIGREEEADSAARSLVERLRKPIRHAGRMIECRASIGVAIYPDHADVLERLVKCADLALASAKVGRGRAIIFQPAMSKTFNRAARLLSLARRAVGSERIAPHYQPKVDLTTGGIVGFEALVRWEGSGGRALHPEIFALAFEDRELAAEISRRTIARVCRDMRTWLDERVNFGHVAINSCGADFAGNDFAERLLAALEAKSLSPKLLQLEVTEGVFIGRGAHHVTRALAVLTQQGVKIALDDFGTGYASLTHLKQFPVDVLKVDRSFVSGVGRNADDTAIVRAVLGLGKSLGIETVAEGIETHEQAAFVRSHGCTLGQGYLYGAARPASEIPRMIFNAAKRVAA